MYKLLYTKSVVKELKKMDKHVSTVIVSWLKKNIDNCDNPRIHGKGLTADKVGMWRYRIGNYRVLVNICDDKLIVYALVIGHRRDIYNSKFK